mmetsp:Transcript_4403/g.3689  ORF Transcript_4403/g.3689 Transcript_4403/m.3689 type:complete len:123 (+) Transcript_4403:742-1110(+)
MDIKVLIEATRTAQALSKVMLDDQQRDLIKYRREILLKSSQLKERDGSKTDNHPRTFKLFHKVLKKDTNLTRAAELYSKDEIAANDIFPSHSFSPEKKTEEGYNFKNEITKKLFKEIMAKDK